MYHTSAFLDGETVRALGGQQLGLHSSHRLIKRLTAEREALFSPIR